MTFGIESPSALLDKLIEEQRDFRNEHCLSARHAINAIMTAYHLHEWVWGAFLKKRHDLHSTLQLSPGRKAECHDFRKWLERECPAMADAEKITNGTKHFRSDIPTGRRKGAFQRNAFQSNAFAVSYLWIERDGGKQKAEEFIQELVDFWSDFFAKYKIP
jgi:hypothetical protein